MKLVGTTPSLKNINELYGFLVRYSYYSRQSFNFVGVCVRVRARAVETVEQFSLSLEDMKCDSLVSVSCSEDFLLYRNDREM